MQRDNVKTVLLVSEDDQIRSMLRGYLEHVGYAVLICANSQHVSNILRSHHHPDLLVADIGKHNQEVVLLGEELVGRYPQLSVLVISGFPGDGHIREAVESHGWNFLRKPLMLLDLLHWIRDTIDPEILNGPARANSVVSRRSKIRASVARRVRSFS